MATLGVRPELKPNVRQATRQFAELYEGQRFTSNSLKDAVTSILYMKYGEARDPHRDTCLRYLRELRSEGWDIICTSRQRSEYVIRRIA